MSDKFVSFKKQKLDSTPISGKIDSNSNEMTKKYGIGAKLLAQMGYVKGQGLGSGGRGIANPIEPVKRPQGKVGLGMLSSAADRINRYDEDIYSSGDEKMNSSSDDEIINSKIGQDILPTKSIASKFVAFNKKGTVSLNNSERLNLLTKLRDLEINDTNVRITPTLFEDIKNKPDISKDTKLQLLDILQKLDHVNSRLRSLGLRIPNLKLEQQQLHHSNELLLQINESISTKEPLKDETIIKTYIDKIMQVQDDNVMDTLMATFLKYAFLQEPFKSDPRWIVKENLFEKYVIPIIETLHYRIDDESFSNRKLNKTQTVIFQIVFPKIKKLIENTNLKLDLDNKCLITVLVDYETTLKYIHSHDYILQNLIEPKLFDELQNNADIGLASSNLIWLLDFQILFPSHMVNDCQHLIQDIFISYCRNWHYRDPLITIENIKVIRQFIEDDQYHKIVQREFTPTLYSLSEKYFNIENEVHDKINKEKDKDIIDSIDVVKLVRKCRYILHPKDYEVFMFFFFNRINKFLFDWVFYYGEDPEIKSKAQSWFNWFINSVFSGYKDEEIPISKEVAKIRETKLFLDQMDNNKNPIHDENYNIINSLVSNLIGSDEDLADKGKNSDDYTVDTIPIRKVTATFKEVVEDYCVAHGFILEKTSNKYTDISISSNNSILVPIFQVRNKSKHKNVAIKDDILWIEGKDGTYIPTYLRDLKL